MSKFVEFSFSNLLLILKVLATKVFLHVGEAHFFISFEKLPFLVVPALEFFNSARGNGDSANILFCVSNIFGQEFRFFSDFLSVFISVIMHALFVA